MAAAAPPPQDDSSSDEEAQAFYVGGSDHSGQQVLGPKKKKKTASFVDRVLEDVRTHAEEVDPSTMVKSKKPGFFTGAGRRLGETGDDSTEVPQEARPASPREFSLRMWQDGFSVDDGPLRSYEQPDSRRFLDHVSRGQIPPELTALARGGEVTVNMEDKRGETFKAPKQAKKAFTGEGRTLGSISPTTVGMTAEATESDKKADEERAKQELKVNPAEPTTNIQLRLADGSRVVAQFNQTHTLRDVRMFIVRARPQYEVSLFSLMTAFPSQELTDEMATLKDLKLLNAVIIQRVVG